MKIKEHTFGAGVISKIHNRVLYIRFEDSTLEVEQIKKIHSLKKRLIGDKTFGVIVDVRNIDVSLSDKTKDFLLNEHQVSENRLVETIVVNTLSQKRKVERMAKLFDQGISPVRKTFLDVMTAKDWVIMKIKEFDKLDA